MSSLESLRAWAARAVAGARETMAAEGGGSGSWQVGVPGALGLELRLWRSLSGWSVSVHADGAEVEAVAGDLTVEDVLGRFAGVHMREFWESAVRFQSSLAAAGVDVAEMGREALVRDVMES